MDGQLDFKDLSAVQQERLRAMARRKAIPCHTIPTLAIHTKSKHKTRHTDGIGHPITVRKARPDELRRHNEA